MQRNISLYCYFRHVVLYAIGISFVSIHAASAGLLYQQPSVWAGNGTDVGNSWTSQTDVGLNGFRTNDIFSLGSAASVNQASWFGIYLNDDFTDGSPNTSDWIIRFQADNAGAPGAVLLSTTQPAAQVLTQVVGTGFFNTNPVTVYEFTALFPTAFNAAANTTYWFSPLSRAPTFSPFFSWIEGTGGDDASFQTAFTAGVVSQVDSGPRDGDRAFALSNVPEPSTPVLIGATLGVLAFLRQRLPKADR